MGQSHPKQGVAGSSGPLKRRSKSTSKINGNPENQVG